MKHEESKTPVVPTLKKQTKMRYVQWNIEWFDYLFQSETHFLKSNKEAGVDDVDALCKKIAGVIPELDPEIIAIQEGPASLKRMELFISTYLNSSFTAFGALDSGTQQVFLLVKKGGFATDVEYYEPAHKFLNFPWKFDVNGDTTLQEYKYTRVPLVIKAKVIVDGETRSLFAVSMHTKSKFIPNGHKMWKSNKIEERQDFIRKSIKNRRRIAAECARLRKCLDETVYSKHEDPLVIVSGDINDNAGMDFFEEFYLLFDSVDALLGSPSKQQRMLHSQIVKTKFVKEDQQWSIQFDDYIDDIKDRKLLLDHVFVSDALDGKVKNANVSHDVFAKFCDHNWKANRGQRPSDHKPVYIDLF